MISQKTYNQKCMVGAEAVLTLRIQPSVCRV